MDIEKRQALRKAMHIDSRIIKCKNEIAQMEQRCKKKREQIRAMVLEYKKYITIAANGTEHKGVQS